MAAPHGLISLDRKQDLNKLANFEGGSPGLMVMGCNSQSEGCGFESKHRILDWQLLDCFLIKISMFVGKEPKITENMAGVGPFYKK